MNPWLSFLLGVGVGGGLVLLVSCFVVGVLSSTSKMALASMAAMLRGFQRQVPDLRLVVRMDGEPRELPFELVIHALEHAQITAAPPEPGGESRDPSERMH